MTPPAGEPAFALTPDSPLRGPTLADRYGHKIKTPAELKLALGPRPREKKVIMCHGVFDVVHPGHVRHLLFSKSKADILVASLTADMHIDKGKYRPHVPQDLRAANLAAFEMVDYVVIDKNATPIENLGFLQPDFFAKGYEYCADGLPPKTAEEAAVLASYGGEIIFTPGDVVYSSSRLIELEPPSIKYDKLLSLMQRTGVTFDALRWTVEGMAGRSAHVVGDSIVDTLTHCAMIGGQTKTPTMSVLYEDEQRFIGGAGIVAKHLRSAGAEVTFSTVLGDDALKDFVLDGLETAGVRVRAAIDKTRPTTNKNAITVGGYRLLKIDTLDNRSVAGPVLGSLVKSVKKIQADAVVFSDFRHGIFNRRTIPTLTNAIPEGPFRVADSQVASRWGNITEFVGFDLITPNEREGRFALADQDSGVRQLSSDLYDAAICGTLMLKLGDRGVMTCQSRDHEALDSFFSVDSFVTRLVDAVGAGDALLAYATLAMLSSNSPVQASILGSMAAACECERDGNIPVAAEDLLERIEHVERECRFA